MVKEKTEDTMTKDECELIREMYKLTLNHDLLKKADKEERRLEKENRKQERFDGIIKTLITSNAFEVLTESMSKEFKNKLAKAKKLIKDE